MAIFTTFRSVKYTFGAKKKIVTRFLSDDPPAHLDLQSWTLISRHFRNVAENCFSANVPKVLIFGLLVRTGTINDFSYWDWVLGSYWYSYLFQANDHMTLNLVHKSGQLARAATAGTSKKKVKHK